MKLELLKLLAMMGLSMSTPRVSFTNGTPGAFGGRRPKQGLRNPLRRYYERYSHALTEYDTGRNKGTAGDRKRERKQVARDVKALNKLQTMMLQRPNVSHRPPARRGIIRFMSTWNLA